MYVGGRMAELGIERITWYYRRGRGWISKIAVQGLRKMVRAE
jgi:hypothetical protein